MTIVAKPGNKNILQPVDDEAQALARRLLRTARFGALATLDTASGTPVASRVAVATEIDGTPLILISMLAGHTAALLSDPRCCLMIGEPGKGDPLAHPRMSVRCEAQRLDRQNDDGRHAQRRYLNRHPKSSLYADFADFSYFRLRVHSASLNGGFGRAHALDTNHMVIWHNAMAQFLDAEQSAIDHMNSDHADTVDRLVTAAGALPAAGWKLTGIDPEGFDLMRGDIAYRTRFPKMLKSPENIRYAFISMLQSTANK